MFVRYRLIGAVVVASAVLAACSGGGRSPGLTPAPTPTGQVTSAPTSSVSSTSPSPSRTGPLTTGPNVRPGEKPPVFPAAAKRHDSTGALFFASYYFYAFDWSYATNDPYLLRKVSLATCRACASAANGIAGVADRHGILTGGRVHVGPFELDRRKFNVRADYAVDVSTTEQPVVVTLPESKRSTAASAETNFHSIVFVRWVNGAWRVAEVAQA